MQRTSNSLAHYAKGMQLVIDWLTPIEFLPQLVGIRFQVLFYSGSPVLFTFPSRYSCTIGHQIVFSLTRWSWQIPTGFLVPRSTWEYILESPELFDYRVITFSDHAFQTCSSKHWIGNSQETPYCFRISTPRPRFYNAYRL